MRWMFQTDIKRSNMKIPKTPFNTSLPCPCGTKTRRVFRIIVVVPDSEYPLTFGFTSLPHSEFFLSETSAEGAYVVYTFEVGSSH